MFRSAHSGIAGPVQKKWMILGMLTALRLKGGAGKRPDSATARPP